MTLKSNLICLGAAWSVALALSQPASAHFLWLEIPVAAKPSLRMSFGEKAPDLTTAPLLEKIQKVRAWTGEGKALELTQGNGAYKTDLAADAKVVGAEQVWDVMDRRAQGRGVFLLRYYAKAAANTEAASQSARLPVEVLARREGSVYILTVKQEDKPVPQAEVTLSRPGEANPLELKTDEAGEARFTALKSGECQVRAMVADYKAGKHGEKSYDMVRNYSTLTFPVQQGTEDAAQLLQGAQKLRETWRKGFPGFTGHLIYERDGEIAEGTLKVAADGSVEVTLNEADFQDDVKSTFQSLVSHRLGGATNYKPTFGSEDRHSQGRSVLLNDSFKSMYRIKDGQIMQVNRSMGDSALTIDMLKNTRLDNGKYLPSSFAASYRDAATGKLKQVQSFTERYEEVEGFWLPVERQVVTSSEGATSVTHISLVSPRLNASLAAAKKDED